MISERVVIGITGACGRMKALNKRLYEQMIACAEQTISATYDWSRVHLTCGGNAWSDHVAIALYLKYYEEGVNLTLHLPCEFNLRYYNHGTTTLLTGCYDLQNSGNMGRLMVSMHAKFAAATRTNTIAQIAEAIRLGAIVHRHANFRTRNDRIAACVDELIYFGWSDIQEEGGAKRIMEECVKSKKHILELPLEPLDEIAQLE